MHIAGASSAKHDRGLKQGTYPASMPNHHLVECVFETKPVVFAGSTTGPKYSDSTCSPFQVTWSVRPQVAKLDINSVARWCESNEFGEDHAHGVRKLVTSPELLSEID